MTRVILFVSLFVGVGALGFLWTDMLAVLTKTESQKPLEIAGDDPVVATTPSAANAANVDTAATGRNVNGGQANERTWDPKSTRPENITAAAQSLVEYDPKRLRKLDVLSTEAINREQWTRALDHLEEMAVMLRNDRERLMPLLERVRMVKTQILYQEPPVETDPEKRTKHKLPAEGFLSLAIRELGNFAYDTDKGGNIPADVWALNGKTIQLNGFIIPLDQAEHMRSFSLVPSLLECCFGQPPEVHHMIVVNCPEGKSVRYFPGRVIVRGKLIVKEKREEGYIYSVFEMIPSSVQPSPNQD